MSLTLELRLKLLRDFAALCGVGSLIYGVNHLLAAAGSDWGFIERSHPRSQVVIGLVMLGSGAICTWVRFRVGRVVRRMDKHRAELPLRALFVRADELKAEALHRDPSNPQAPKPV